MNSSEKKSHKWKQNHMDSAQWYAYIKFLWVYTWIKKYLNGIKVPYPRSLIWAFIHNGIGSPQQKSMAEVDVQEAMSWNARGTQEICSPRH